MFWGAALAFPLQATLIKPSLRFDYPLNPPNTASLPIRDVGKRWTVH